MTDDSRAVYAGKEGGLAENRGFRWDGTLLVRLLLLAVFAGVLAKLYTISMGEMYRVWRMDDSYYSHGFLVPLISLGIVWVRRAFIFETVGDTSAGWSMVWLAFGLVLLLAGDFLGFRVFAHFSLLPVLVGVSLLLIGKTATLRMWFPIAFLIFMVPIPPSLTQSVTLQLKLVAAELAVRGARALTLPMIREGSYIHFTHNGAPDKLLVGEVCGGLRSLISLLAVGALAAYFSRTRPWARWFLLAMSVPIAIVANVVRIFFLCVVGYFWGSEVAAGQVHDISGILIYVVAFGLFFALEAWLRKVASPRDPVPEKGDAPSGSAPPPAPPTRGVLRLVLLSIPALVLVVAVTVGHLSIREAQGKAARQAGVDEFVLDIPSQVGGFVQYGEDLPIHEAVERKLETSQMLFRGYRSRDGWPVQLSIVYAGKTRRSLHFPEVCLVGEGYDLLKQEKAPVGFSFMAKRLVLVRGEQRQAVLYWFKTGDIMTGNYFLNAAYWARNQLFMGSPTSAMIKVETLIPPGPGGEDAAFAVLENFAIRFAPIALERVP